MTPRRPVLAPLLLRHLSKEAGTLAKGLTLGDPKAHKALEGRARKTLDRMDQAGNSRSFQRRAALALALLEAQGDSLSPDYDPLLLVSLVHLPAALLVDACAALLHSLNTLPEARRLPLLMALTRRVLYHRCMEDAPSDELLHLLQPYTLQVIQDLLRQSHPREYAIQGLDVGYLYTTALLGCLVRLWGERPYPEWLLKKAEQSIKAPPARLGYRDVHPYGPLLLRMPQDRRLALFKRHPEAMLPQPALCNHPELMEALAQHRPSYAEPWQAHIFARTLAQDQPESFVLLLEALRQSSVGRPHLWEGARVHTQPQHAPWLVALLEISEPTIALQSAQRLARESPQAVLEHLGEDWFPSQARGQRLAARVLRAWSLHSDQSALIQHLLPRVEDQRARATLERALQPAAQQWQEALALRRALPGSLPAELQDLWAAYRKLRSVQSSRGAGFYNSRTAWYQALEQHFDEPVVLLLAADLFEINSAQLQASLEEQHTLLGAALPLAVRTWWEAGEGEAQTRTVLPWLLQHAPPSPASLLRVLRQGDLPLKQLALEHLPPDQKEALDHLCEMLADAKASERTRGARLITLRPGPRAAQALRQALDQERSKSAREAMEEALALCDPTLRQFNKEGHDTGSYALDQPYPARDGMERLRVLLYEEATPQSWIQLCDLLERMEDSGSLKLALDYLPQEALERWKPEERPVPMGWEEHPHFSRFVLAEHQDPRDTWFPIWRLTRMSYRDKTLQPMIKRAQHGTRARRFTPELVDVFLQSVQMAWRWCQEEGMPLEDLEVCVDGGSVARNYMMRAETTAMVLWMGFGVRVQRQNAQRIGVRPGGLNQLRVSVPLRHPLRSKYDLQGRKRYLDLLPLLAP